MELLKQYGYSLVFFVILLEQLGLPLPAAPVLVLAGAIAAGGNLNIGIALLAAIAGCLIGDVVWFWIGRKKGRGVLKFLCHISLSPETCVKKTEESFLRYGMNSLLFAKFVPGLNTIAPPMAGMFSRSFLAFVWRDLAGSLLYVLSFLTVGFVFEMAVFDVTALLESFGRTIFWLIIAALAAYVLTKYIKLKLLQKLLFRERITVAELSDRLAAGEPLLIVDIRASKIQEEKGIPGAIRIRPNEIDQHVTRLDKDRWIVLYCT